MNGTTALSAHAQASPRSHGSPTPPFTFLAVGSGEQLEETVERTANERLLEAHTEIGENLRPWILLLFLVVLGIMLWDRYRERVAAGGSAEHDDDD